MEARYDPETIVAPPNMGDGQDSVIDASVQDSMALLGRSTSSTEQPLSLNQDCSKISTSSSQYGFRSLDLRDESGADVCRKQNEVLIRSEMQRLFSDDSLSSSKRDDSFSSLYDYSLTSLSTDTHDSVSSMYRAATPIDTLELPQEPIFPEDPGPLLYQNSAQYYRNLSHETDTDQSLTMSIPQKDNYSHPGTLKTINGLIPFTSLSEVNAKSSEQAAYRNSSPTGWDPDVTDKAIEGSYSKQQNTSRQSSPSIELSKTLGNHIDPSIPSPLPSAFNNSHPSSLGNSSNVTEYDSTNSSDFEEEINGMDHGILQQLTSSILDELLGIFYRQLSLSKGRPNEAASGNTTSRHQNRTATPKQGDSPSKDSGTSLRGKRRRKDSDQHQSGDEGDEDRYPHKKLHLDRPVEVQPTFWACPFSKWKPLSYRKCCQYILKDISRVKQHLRRYHERPPYCPVCWEVFREEDGFESHIQDRTCSPRPKTDLEGITPTQQKQLERRSDKQLSKPEQWYAIYTILFPGQPHPDSPYLESDLSSELLLLQKFIATDGLEIVERKAREHIPPDLMPHEDEVLAYSQALFQQAIPEILQRYDASRPINNGPEILKRSGLSSLSGNDCDSGYGTLSQVSQDRSTQNKGLGTHKEQDHGITNGIDHTGFDWTSIDDVQIQALLTKSQVTADAAQCQDLSIVQISLERGSQHFTPYGSLDLPSNFTLHPCDEHQLFGLNESEATLANGPYNWDAAVGAIFDNNGTSASTDHS
ncbi:uncharacterized protein F4817DRAFT_320204 [Daldinia loculata]|uniref:uncharacterized protein n=1 Tax=Daldinia loculata TaxID=103429 RepID=UPI0020C576B7|nr:uncharacterized protein F4817DRAFT_320204 [Daldinia loculata]KAI1643011.1 hypothetical protein F4817DRAFT_320204 [Daldinia loculata]